MNWKLIFLLAGLGVIMGVGTLYGATRDMEPLLWLAIGVYCAFMLSRRAGHSFFTHGLLTGLFISVLHFAILLVFYASYEVNNPPSVELVREHGNIMVRRQLFLYAALVIIPAASLVMGLLSLGADRLLNKFAKGLRRG
ncbi:MAG: hypothetical protein ACOZB3_07545 [Calditrichota bacterium]